MPAFLVLLLIVALMAGGLLFWLLRRPVQTGARASTGFAASYNSEQDTIPMTRGADGAWHGWEDDEDDQGPATVLSYMDVPDNQRPSSAPATPPAEDPPPLSGDDPGWQRIRSALGTLSDGPLDQAWAALQGFLPEPAQREVAMDTMERIALAYEREQRYDRARDVYEHMADIDPQWRQVKLRLMRARGLAQAATVNTWGTVPPRPMPKVTMGQLGKYVLVRQIGRGAMGAVYLGHDPAIDREVALKTMALAQEFSGDDLADARARFLREAEMAGRLQHPDIVSILDAGEVDGLAYIAMEMVEGTDLSAHARPGSLLPLAQLLPVVARVAEALAYAHTRGVTHRDIKPANVMVDLAHDTVKVMDFGVARVADAARTRTGVVLGTPTFMSPEQLSGQPIDGRSDLYSLGVTLFLLLTGQLPYASDNMAALMRAIGQDTPPNVCTLRPELPAALGDIVALALQKHPGTRYQDGREMAEDLRRVAQDLPTPDIPLA
ncbi:serine/threonine-protein kinase [Aquabacterium sp. A3]|uniref:serine/threonine-protein kinase n=1 Tax=Aquabacterium sp. A3 TaxID=3132829 RepID=UPI003119A62F